MVAAAFGCSALFFGTLFDDCCIFLLGRLVLDADNIPMVVPFVHSGMQDIMPIGASIPRIGKTVGSLMLAFSVDVQFFATQCPFDMVMVLSFQSDILLRL